MLKMSKLLMAIFIFIPIFSPFVLAQNFNHLLPGEFDEKESIYNTEEIEGLDEHIMGVDITEDEFFKKEKEAPFNFLGTTIPGSFENMNSKTVEAMAHKRTSGVTISYYLDRFNFKGNRSDIFNLIFEKSSRSRRFGMILISFQRYFFHDFSSLTPLLSLGINMGFSHAKGKGHYFSGVEESGVLFTLWTIPLDFSLGMEFSLDQWIKISASGGPSLLALYQNRNDRNYGEEGKRRTQWGHGYFAAVKFQGGLSKFFPSMGFKSLAYNKISAYFFNVEARFQNYQKFKDGFTVSGLSFGIGFTFEFL